MSKGELLSILNGKNKKRLTEKDVFKSSINLSLLKKIDKVFQKGLSYYVDPKDPIKSEQESIFFRKDSFNAVLSLGAKQIVNKFEEDKISFSVLAQLSDFIIKRKIPIYKLSDSPRETAQEVRKFLYPKFNSNVKIFLENFISTLSEYNILVFEFVETWNKKERANINGIFLTPNTIVLKRNQKSFRREIFTLAHELGHYLLNEEEIDGNIKSNTEEYDKLNATEKWCSNFAFYFLAGQYSGLIENLEKASSSNDYHHEKVKEVSQRTHLSESSLYFRLWINNTVTISDYNNIVLEISERIKARELSEKEELERKKQKDKEEGRKTSGGTPKPIISPLYLRTLQGALYGGIINEREFCRKLNIAPNKLEQYLI